MTNLINDTEAQKVTYESFKCCFYKTASCTDTKIRKSDIRRHVTGILAVTGSRGAISLCLESEVTGV